MRAHVPLLAVLLLVFLPVASATTLVLDAGGTNPRCYVYLDGQPAPPETWVENNGDETSGEGPGLQRAPGAGPDGEEGTSDDVAPDVRFPDPLAWARWCTPST